MNEPRRQVIKKIDGKPVIRQTQLSTSLETSLRTLEHHQDRIREFEATTAAQASEIATLRLELATARDPLLTERLHDLEKQVGEYQKVLAQRTAECQALQTRVQDLEASRKSHQLQAGIDVGGSTRDM